MLEQINNRSSRFSLTLKPGWEYPAVQVEVLYFTCGRKFLWKLPKILGIFMPATFRSPSFIHRA